VEKFIKVEEILSEALALPPQNRASLAEKLNESLYNSNVAGTSLPGVKRFESVAEK
jgi:hypothetical protein